jgi:transposase
LAKYGLATPDVAELFGSTGREVLAQVVVQLPPHITLLELELIEEQIFQFETRMRQVFTESPALNRLITLPGVGFILGLVILLEIGDVNRFPRPMHVAGCAGTTHCSSSSLISALAGIELVSWRVHQRCRDRCQNLIPHLQGRVKYRRTT